MKIKAGTSLRKYSARGGGKWHQFQEDCTASVKMCNRTYSTVLVVGSGLDKGRYNMPGC